MSANRYAPKEIFLQPQFESRKRCEQQQAKVQKGLNRAFRRRVSIAKVTTAMTDILHRASLANVSNGQTEANHRCNHDAAHCNEGAPPATADATSNCLQKWGLSNCEGYLNAVDALTDSEKQLCMDWLLSSTPEELEKWLCEFHESEKLRVEAEDRKDNAAAAAQSKLIENTHSSPNNGPTNQNDDNKPSNKHPETCENGKNEYNEHKSDLKETLDFFDDYPLELLDEECECIEPTGYCKELMDNLTETFNKASNKSTWKKIKIDRILSIFEEHKKMEAESKMVSLTEKKRHVEQFLVELCKLFTAACCEDDEEFFDGLLKLGIAKIPSISNNELHTPLHAAALANKTNYIEKLLAVKLNLNATNCKGQNALHTAAENGSFEAAKLLIEKGIMCDQSDYDGLTPMFAAMQSKEPRAIEIFELIYESLCKKYQETYSFFCHAVYTNSLKLFTKSVEVLEKKNIEITELCVAQSFKDLFDQDEFIPDPELITKLVKDFNAIEIVKKVFNEPIIMIAIENGYFSSVKTLIDLGVDVDTSEITPNSPFIEAVMLKEKEIAEYLLQNHAVAHSETDFSICLFAACSMGSYEIIKWLMDKGAEPTIDDFYEFFTSCSKDFAKIINILVRFNKLREKLNIKILERALAIACGSGYKIAAEYLISKKVAINCIDSHGHTPLIKAIIGGHLDMVKFLVENDAQFVYTYKGIRESAIVHACRVQDKHMVHFLLNQQKQCEQTIKLMPDVIIEATKSGNAEVFSIVTIWANKLRISLNALQEAMNAKSSPKKSKNVPQPPENLKQTDNQYPSSEKNVMEDDKGMNKVKSNELMVKAKQKLIQSRKTNQELLQNKTILDKKKSSLTKSIEKNISQCLRYIKNDPELLQKVKELNESEKDYFYGKVIQDNTINIKNQESVGFKSPENCAAKPGDGFFEVDLKDFSDYCHQTSDCNESVNSDKNENFDASIFEEFSEHAIHQIAKIGNYSSSFDFSSDIAESFPNYCEKLREKMLKAPGTCSNSGNEYSCCKHCKKQRQLSNRSSSSSQYFNMAAKRILSSTKSKLSSMKVSKSQKGPVNFDATTVKSLDTPLTIACSKGYFEIVELLLASGVNLEHQNRRGLTPLMIASENGYHKIVYLLLKAGACCNAPTERTHDTALGFACSSKSLQTVKLLVRYKADINHMNINEYTPLCYASSAGSLEIVRFLLDNGSMIDGPQEMSKSGITPLMLATMQNHPKVAELLLERNALVDLQIETNKNSALTLSAIQNYSQITKMLIQAGSNKEHKNKSGMTPLMEALSRSSFDSAKVLLEAKADPNPTPSSVTRDTPLTFAASHSGALRIVKMLVAANANINARNKKGNSALWISASNGLLNIVTYLTEVGHADVDSKNLRGMLPIFAAFVGGHLPVVNYLANLVSQFPNDKEIFSHLNTFQSTNSAKIQAQDEPTISLIANMNESINVLCQAKELRTKHANNAIKTLMNSFRDDKDDNNASKSKSSKKSKKKSKINDLKKSSNIVSLMSESESLNPTITNPPEQQLQTQPKVDVKPNKIDSSQLKQQKETSATALMSNVQRSKHNSQDSTTESMSSHENSLLSSYSKREQLQNCANNDPKFDDIWKDEEGDEIKKVYSKQNNFNNSGSCFNLYEDSSTNSVVKNNNQPKDNNLVQSKPITSNLRSNLIKNVPLKKSASIQLPTNNSKEKSALSLQQENILQTIPKVTNKAMKKNQSTQIPSHSEFTKQFDRKITSPIPFNTNQTNSSVSEFSKPALNSSWSDFRPMGRTSPAIPSKSHYSSSQDYLINQKSLGCELFGYRPHKYTEQSLNSKLEMEFKKKSFCLSDVDLNDLDHSKMVSKLGTPDVQNENLNNIFESDISADPHDDYDNSQPHSNNVIDEMMKFEEVKILPVHDNHSLKQETCSCQSPNLFSEQRRSSKNKLNAYNDPKLLQISGFIKVTPTQHSKRDEFNLNCGNCSQTLNFDAALNDPQEVDTSTDFNFFTALSQKLNEQQQPAFNQSSSQHMTPEEEFEEKFRQNIDEIRSKNEYYNNNQNIDSNTLFGNEYNLYGISSPSTASTQQTALSSISHGGSSNVFTSSKMGCTHKNNNIWSQRTNKFSDERKF